MQDFLQKILHDENRIYTPRRKKKNTSIYVYVQQTIVEHSVNI